MVFSSNIFLFLFLPIILALYFVPLENFGFKKYKNYLLLLASLIFYSWGELCYLWLLLLSIIGNYYFGLAIKGDIYAKKIRIFFALTFNLSLLAYFKYANFIVDNILSLFPSYGYQISKVVLPDHLPIGISFFSFHAISYLIDIYRGKCKAQKNLFDLALYIAFFPQLIAGPIVRYNAIEKYLRKRQRSLFAVAQGIRRFVIGLAKKVIIANPLGEVADLIFSSQIDGLSSYLAWIGIICYTMQIYFDFSGYCDMAIGLARVFGFKFPENFNYPYIAKSIKEFWRRWHMSLSSWFRDYVYIPLGGNKCSLTRQYFNLILVFFLCGLWHGASWTFVAWGLFHGFFLAIERIKAVEIFLRRIPQFFQHIYMLFVVIIGWVLFRSDSLNYAIGYLKLMFVYTKNDVVPSNIASLINSHFVWTVFLWGLVMIGPLLKNFSERLARKYKIFLLIADLFLLVIFILSIVKLSSATHNPFIYFQF